MEYYTIDDFSLVEKYDGHLHLNTYGESFVKQSVEEHFKLITINVDVASDFPTIKQQQDFAVQQLKKFHGSVHFASTFSVKNFTDANWLEETIAFLKNSFSAGAIAVKVWKNIGMELKDSNGNFVMIDHPQFDPIFDFLIKNNIPLIGHLGEPKNCWLPIKKMTVKGDVNYFSAHPEYHMYLRPEYPSYEDQINARDRRLEKHADLQFIGAHLGSLEWIIYGTDIIVDGTKDPLEMKKHAHDIRLRHWKFFTSDEMMLVPKVDGEFKGLKLPREVVDKIYRTNAEKWFQ